MEEIRKNGRFNNTFHHSILPDKKILKKEFNSIP